MTVYFIFATPFILALLFFGLIFAIYMLVKVFVKLVRWIGGTLKSLICWMGRVTRRAITKGLALGRRILIYMARYMARIVNHVVGYCNRGITYVTQRFFRRGVPTYQTPRYYDTEQRKDPDPPYYSMSYPSSNPVSPSTSPPAGFKGSNDMSSTKLVEKARFCQICGASLDHLDLSNPDVPAICRECGSELSLGIDPICRKHVLLGEDAVRCPHCLTVFHRHHVVEWASSHGRCPFCNATLLQEIT